MAIEMTSNGRRKTYCYYPTDVLYANGKQIKEVWVDGVKYYPKIYNENNCVIRFFTDDFMSRSVPQRYFRFGEPDWISIDALLWANPNNYNGTYNEYDLYACYNDRGDVPKISFNSTSFFNDKMWLGFPELSFTDYASVKLAWSRGDRTSNDSTYNPGQAGYYRNYNDVHGGIRGLLYRYRGYDEDYPQFFKDSNMYFKDRTMSSFITSKSLVGKPEWYDIMFNYKKPLEIYRYDVNPSQLLATYSYENGFQKTDNYYERYADFFGGLEPLFIETGFFDV